MAPLSGRVEIRDLSVRFGGHAAIEGFGLAIEAGEFVCLLGPSGCGKSTVLNAVAGLVPVAGAKVVVDGKPVSGPGADRGMVFQQYSLFPWKTVLENVAFGPRMQGTPRPEARRKAREYLEFVGLSAFADKYPATLSGGMQQRVGIARALVNHPSVLLMHEPFAALDAQTRGLMQENLLRLWDELSATVIFVTHDVDEALYLADRVVVMSAAPGRVLLDLEIGLPRPLLTTSSPCQPLPRRSGSAYGLSGRRASAPLIISAGARNEKAAGRCRAWPLAPSA
jgi:NitT/TauT family transport system ATP-binding protein